MSFHCQELVQTRIGVIAKKDLQDDSNFKLLLRKLRAVSIMWGEKSTGRSWKYHYETIAFIIIELKKFGKRKDAYKFSCRMHRIAEKIYCGKTLSPLDAFTLLVISKDLMQILSDKRNERLANGYGDTYLRRNF